MADWNFSDYQTAADALWAKADKAQGTAGVVKIKKNGASALGLDQEVLQQFADGLLASPAYDAVAAAPGDVWYVALYDEVKALTSSGRVDETYFGGMGTVSQVKRPIAPVVAIGLAAGLAVFAGRKKRRR